MTRDCPGSHERYQRTCINAGTWKKAGDEGEAFTATAGCATAQATGGLTLSALQDGSSARLMSSRAQSNQSQILVGVAAPVARSADSVWAIAIPIPTANLA